MASFHFRVLLTICACISMTQAFELKLKENYTVSWHMVGNDTIMFHLNVEIHPPAYIGFGISPHGGMIGADIAAIIVNANGSAEIKDMHGVGNTRPVFDKSQDYKLDNVKRNETSFQIKFYRLINTCDPEDLEISMESTQYIIWASGLIDNSTKELKYHEMGRSSRAVNLLDPVYDFAELRTHKVWKLHQSIRTTSAETLYWCKFHRSPKLDKKHHITGFSMDLDNFLAEKHVHHASVLSCTPPEGEDAEMFFGKYVTDVGFDCYYSRQDFPTDQCTTYDFQWTTGGTTTVFPKYVGVPLGIKVGNSSTMFYMTKIHIANPQRTPGLTFNAGFDLYYTDKLRSADAGFFQIGLNSTKIFSLTVPPKSSDHVLSSHCPMECIQHLPEDGINVFIYLLHSHLAGRKMRVRHFRNGTELPWIANDENLDAGYKNNRLLKHEVRILPSDHITVECTYDSTSRNGSIVLGGRGITDEMCQAFLMYYPKVNGINRCGSSVPPSDILDFMGIGDVILARNDNDPMILEPKKWNGIKYGQIVAKEIHWTKEKRWAYQQMTRYNYQDAECTALGPGNKISTKYPDLKKRHHEYIPADQCMKKMGAGGASTTNGNSGMAGAANSNKTNTQKPKASSGPRIQHFELALLSCVIVVIKLSSV